MDRNIISEIIIKVMSGDDLIQHEKEILDKWLAESEANGNLFRDLKNEDYVVNKLKDRQLFNVEEAKASFHQWRETRGRVVKFRMMYRYVAAAVILFAAITVFWLYNNKSLPKGPSHQTIVQKPNDVEPGKTKAVLTLADGRKIILDSAANGKLAQQGSAVLENNNGQLVYNNNSGGEAYKNLFNMLSTNKGEIYATILSDGSKIWLNSGSSIRYPVIFTGDERRIEITGEAYFEVAHNPSKPFIVKMNDMQVQVLGTHFNINSYNDEPLTKTTLLEGSVRISTSNGMQILKPGQQAQISKSNEMEIINNADVDQAIAWKNGAFSFRNTDLPSVMRQLSRWYDVDVEIAGNSNKKRITGRIGRNLSLSEVLEGLETLGVHGELTGKKLKLTVKR